MSEAKKSTFDHQLLFIAICLVAFGLVMNFSNGNSVRSIQQLKAVSFGIVGFCFVYIVPLHLYQKYAYHFLFITVISLLLVFTPVGHEVVSQNHNQTFHRWIKVGAFQFQPVELAKLGFIIYMAHFIVIKQDNLHSLHRGVFPFLSVLGIIFFLLVLQPDFGSAVLISLIALGLLWVGGARLTQILLVLSVAILLIYGWIQNDSYKMERLTNFIQAKGSVFGTHYQLEQSLNAIASGGIFGSGIGNSIYKLGRLPYAHTDFVFSVVSEELGLFGAISLIGLYMLLVWRGIQIALRVSRVDNPITDKPNQFILTELRPLNLARFGSLIALGITAQLGLQAFINIGVALGALPTKGITLPFISYGGSSLMMSIINIGILLNISNLSSTEGVSSPNVLV